MSLQLSKFEIKVFVTMETLAFELEVQKSACLTLIIHILQLKQTFSKKDERMLS